MSAVVNVEQSKILALRLESVRPFGGQPRTDFDLERLTELADSIKEFGQQVAIIVRELPEPDGVVRWEVIDGERRFRACKIAGVPTVRAEVRGAKDEDHQFMQSVVANFGREDHTAVETIKAVARVYGMHEYAALPTMRRYERVGAVFARSGQWVQNQLRLWSLPDEVLAMLSAPKERRLHPQAAMQLVAVHDAEKQTAMAREIVARQMKLPQASLFIRTSGAVEQRSDGRRGRKPSDDMGLMLSNVVAIAQKAELLVGMPVKGVRAALENRPQMREMMGRRVDEAMRGLQMVKKLLSDEPARKA